MNKLKARIACTRSGRKKTFFSQHDNARPRASLKITKCVTKFGWTVLSHPPYSPDLAPSHFHQFGPLKEGLRKQHFVDNNALIDAVENGLPQLEESAVSSAAYRPARSSLEKCIALKCIENVEK